MNLEIGLLHKCLEMRETGKYYIEDYPIIQDTPIKNGVKVRKIDSDNQSMIAYVFFEFWNQMDDGQGERVELLFQEKDLLNFKPETLQIWRESMSEAFTEDRRDIRDGMDVSWTLEGLNGQMRFEPYITDRQRIVQGQSEAIGPCVKLTIGARAYQSNYVSRKEFYITVETAEQILTRYTGLHLWNAALVAGINYLKWKNQPPEPGTVIRSARHTTVVGKKRRCKESGCLGIHFAKGWCRKCYNRFTRGKGERKCKICGDKHHAKDLCKKHYKLEQKKKKENGIVGARGRE